MALYKMAIVDDENYIRENLPFAFNWEQMGFEIVTVCESGAEILAYLKDHKLDLILSDIKMVHMSGVELAKIVSTDFPNTKVILLSGYESFEYAKLAIDAHVYSYIIKPASEEEIQDVLGKLKIDLDEEHIQNYNLNSTSIADLVAKHIKDEIATRHMIENENIITQYIVADFNTDTVKERSESEQERVKSCKSSLLQYVQLQNYSAIRKEFSNYLSDSTTLHYESVREITLFFFLVLQAELYKQNIDIYGANNNGFSFLNIILLKDNTEINDYINKTLDYIIEQASQKQMSTKGKFVNQVIDIIMRDYQKNISLDDVSKEVFLSTMYIGRIFKEYTGVSFTDYIINVRIEKAKELLKSNSYKVYEVIEMVGYKDAKYFTKLFKNITGYTPREYKNMD